MFNLITKSLAPFSQFVKLTRLEGNLNKVARLELANPKKKNALSLALLDDVLHIINVAGPSCQRY